MPNQIIDLRKIARGTDTLPQPAGLTEKTPGLVEWSAYEYTPKDRSPQWFLSTGAVALLLIILGIITKSYFFIAFVALAYGVMVLYAQRPPQKIVFFADAEGIHAGKTLYKFPDLKSFWIFEEPHVRELSLETKKTLLPFLHLPLGDGDVRQIRNLLTVFLPEKEHKQLFSDEIARSLGF